MVGTRRSKLRKAGGVARIDKAQNLFVVLHRGNLTLLTAQLTPQPGQKATQNESSVGLGKCRMKSASKGGCIAALGGISLFDMARRLFDVTQGPVVAGRVVIVPGDEAVLPHHDGGDVRLFLDDVLHGQAQLETGPHPGDVGHPTAKQLLREFSASF